LTSRELQIVRLVADGRINKAIGIHLSLSALTVKNHLARIGRKFVWGPELTTWRLPAGVVSSLDQSTRIGN